MTRFSYLAHNIILERIIHAVVSSSQFTIELAPGMDYMNETAVAGSNTVFVAQGNVTVFAETVSHKIQVADVLSDTSFSFKIRDVFTNVDRQHLLPAVGSYSVVNGVARIKGLLNRDYRVVGNPSRTGFDAVPRLGNVPLPSNGQYPASDISKVESSVIGNSLREVTFNGVYKVKGQPLLSSFMISASSTANLHLRPSEGSTDIGVATANVPNSINGKYQVIESGSSSFKVTVDLDNDGSLGADPLSRLYIQKKCSFLDEQHVKRKRNEFRARAMGLPPSSGWSEASFEGDNGERDVEMQFSYTFDERGAPSPCDVNQWEAVLGDVANTPRKEYFAGKCGLDTSSDTGRNCSGGVDRNSCVDFRTAMEWVNDQPKNGQKLFPSEGLHITGESAISFTNPATETGEFTWED